MALTRILSRTFSTALKHTRVVYPVTINPDSKPCSKRLIGPLFRNFCTSPVVSDDMQMSVTEDLIYSVKSLRATEEMSDFDTEGNNEKATEKMSDFSEAMAPQNTSDGEKGNYETVPDGKERDSLRKEIESEIVRAVEFDCVCRQGRIFPDDFPFNVDDDIHGVASVTFSRRNTSENIHVTVTPPNIFTSITAETYHYHKSCSFLMRLHVEIDPLISEGRSMAFDCSAYSTGYLIENVYGFDHDTKGLDFSELSENLQKIFKKYLETRGITTSTTNRMFGYMLDKVNREKLRCLFKFKELVEA